jgi:hypothetical protein
MALSGLHPLARVTGADTYCGQGLHSRKPLLRWLLTKGFYTGFEADERGRKEALESVNNL